MLDFPAGGLHAGQHGRFACDAGHAMASTALTPFPRHTVNVFCWKIADELLGWKMEWRLENGAPVPLCKEGGN